jgi:threonine dehydrogenase-like Zn-dependent dehydrogenase
MKAAIVSEKNRLEVVDIPMPQVGAYDCLVKIDACAICTGTDSSIISGTFPWPQKYPFVLGHESTGIIIEIGEKVRNFKIGQRVTRPAAVMAGEERDGLSGQWGGYAQYGMVRDVEAALMDGVEANGMLKISRVPLSDGVDPISAALSVNQREILSVVRRIELNAESKVLVIGTGYNGLLFSLFCKHYGAGRVVVIGNPVFASLAQWRYRADAFVDYRDPQARLFAMNLAGTPTHVIDAVGTTESVNFAQTLLSEQTAFGCYGVHNFNETAAARDGIAQSHPQINMSTDEPNTVDEWHTLWKQGFFDQLYDRVMPLEQIGDAFASLARREVVKIVLEIP